MGFGPFDFDEKEMQEKYLLPVAEYNIGVALGIIFPFTPISSLYRGEDPDKVASQTVASALSTWLIAQYYGATIPLGGVAAARGPVFTAVARSSAPAIVGTAAFVSARELQKTLHANVGMEPIPGSGGGYSNPMGGGSDETYYPFKGLVDRIFG